MEITLRSPSPRVVLVTGSSSGIGRACADSLAQDAGTRVYGCSRSEPQGHAWQHLPMDVTDEASVTAAVARILEHEGRLDAVVHCAGVSLLGPIEETSVLEAQKHLDTNYFGAVRVLRAVLPQMRRQGSGKILLIGSIAGVIGLPFLAHYSASKFALDGLCEALRTEIAPSGVQATVLHLGDFRTDLGTHRTVAAEARAGSWYGDRVAAAATFYAAAEHNGGDPRAVARKVVSLLRGRTLPPKVYVGAPLEIAGVWGKAWLPARAFEAVVRLAYGPQPRK